MPKIFLSHKTEDKSLVLKAEQVLMQSLIETWMDKDSMAGGDQLGDKILKGINESAVFAAFISERYFDSNWCPKEFQHAYQRSIAGQIRILPILIGDVQKILEKSKENSTINSVLSTTKYVTFDQYDPQKSHQEILDAIWNPAFEKVRFKPVKSVTLEGLPMQIISFETDSLPSDFLNTWQFSLDKFISTDPEDDKPIKFGQSIGFFGRGPNWIYGYLAIPLANKRNVFMYNTSTNDFICVYANRDRPELLGKTVKHHNA